MFNDLLESLRLGEILDVEAKKEIVKKLKAERDKVFKEEGRSERYREIQRELRKYEWG